MIKYIKRGIVCSFVLLGLLSCEEGNDLVDEYNQQGPIIYAAKVNTMITQSGYERFRVNLYPGEDQNRDYCTLSWTKINGERDSLRVNYTEENYDELTESYYAVVDLEGEKLSGNLTVDAQNTDVFGNTSLITEATAYIYGPEYVASLNNDVISFNDNADKIIVGRSVGSVGNYISYQKSDDSFTDEVYVEGDEFPIENTKSGGIVRNRTRLLITETDIDTLEIMEYSETKIPYAKPSVIDYCQHGNGDYYAEYAFDGVVDGKMWFTGWQYPDHQSFHNNNSDPTLAHYYVIDYKDEFLMNSITIHSDNVGFLKTVDIWISNDAQYKQNPAKIAMDRSSADYWRVPNQNNWVKIGTLNMEKVANDTKTLNLDSPTEFRMIMLTMPDSHNTGNGNIRISEIKVDAERIDN